MRKKWISILLAAVLCCGSWMTEFSSAIAAETLSYGEEKTKETGRTEAWQIPETFKEDSEIKEAAEEKETAEPEEKPETDKSTESEEIPGTKESTESENALEIDQPEKSEEEPQSDQVSKRESEKEQTDQKRTEDQTEPEELESISDTALFSEDKSELENVLAAAGMAEQPYGKQKISELYGQGNLIFSEEMQVTLEEDKEAGGMLITAPGSQLSTGRFTIASGFDFSGNSVGRIEVDGLAPKGKSISLAFYLDDETEAFTAIPLTPQKKSGKWKYEGDKTADVLDKHITGEHRISFQVITDETEDITFLLRSITFAESSLPVIYFNIDESQGSIQAMNTDPEHETECYGNMTVQIPEGYVSEYTDKALTTETYELEYIRGRGNSTWMCDKKPYKLKLDKKADLFGMGKNKHWVLLANRLDNSMLRNKATYWLGQELGMSYTPEAVFVEVVMNGTYYGTYCLSEQIRVGSSRVDIDDLEEDEETKHAVDEPIITGGYLLSMFPYGDEEKKSFTTTQGNEFLIESPSFEDYENEVQYNYIKNYVQNTEDAIYGKDFKNKAGISYTELMDVDSAIDYYWIQEISANGDAFASTSTYLYKMRNGKLYWGPLWDFDYVAWASYEYEDENESYTGFVQKESTWFSRLFEDKTFAERMVKRWPAMKEKLLALCAEGGALDRYYNQLVISHRYDYEKWGSNDFGQVTSLTLKEEENRLRSWIQKRVAWIDENVNSLVPVECTIKYMSEGKLYTTQKINSGNAIKKLPKAPVKKGYEFAGWYGKEDGMEFKLSSGYFISGNMTFRAKWVKEKNVKKVENLYFEQKDVYIPIWDEMYCMNYDVLPIDATITDVTWKSSDEKVATVDEYGEVTFLKTGTVKITGTCHNGVSASYKLHILDGDEDLEYPYEMLLNKSSVKLAPGKWTKLTPKLEPVNCETRGVSWFSLDPEIADVTSTGVVIGNQEGTTSVVAYNVNTCTFAKCKVTVTETVKKGDKFTVSGLEYQVTKTGKNGGTVTCTARAENSVKTVKIPAVVKIKGKTYKVTAVGKNAFKKTDITSVTLGSNIASVKAGAFCNCKKLSAITIKSKKLKAIGSKALKGIKNNATIKVPQKKLEAYKKLLKPATGFLKKTMKIRKIS